MYCNTGWPIDVKSSFVENQVLDLIFFSTTFASNAACTLNAPMADQAAAADLAADVAAQGALMATLRKRKAALDRAVAESSEDTSLLSHFQCLEQDVVAAVNTAGPGGMNALHVACLQGSAAIPPGPAVFTAATTFCSRHWKWESNDVSSELSATARSSAALLLRRVAINAPCAATSAARSAAAAWSAIGCSERKQAWKKDMKFVKLCSRQGVVIDKKRKFILLPFPS